MITINTRTQYSGALIKLFFGILLINLLLSAENKLQAQNSLLPTLEVNPDITAYIENWVHVYSIVLHVENTSHAPIEFYIQAEMYNGNNEKVAQISRSPLFYADPGPNSFFPAQFFFLQDFEFFGGIAAIVRATGLIPEDFYQLCFRLVDKDGQPLSDEYDGCGEIIVKPCENPFLLHPMDKDTLSLAQSTSKIDPIYGFTFEWSHEAPTPQKYHFRLVRVLPGRSAEEALRVEVPAYEETVFGLQFLIFPMSLVLLPGEYVWTVQVCDEFNETALTYSQLTLVEQVEEQQKASCECTCAIEIKGPDPIVLDRPRLISKPTSERCFTAVLTKECTEIADWDRFLPLEWTVPDGWTINKTFRPGMMNDTEFCLLEAPAGVAQTLKDNKPVEVTISAKATGEYTCWEDKEGNPSDWRESSYAYTKKNTTCSASKTFRFSSTKDPAGDSEEIAEETVPEIPTGNPGTKDCCQCILSDKWETDPPIIAGLAYPEGSFEWPWAKPLPMKAVAYDVDRLDASCDYYQCKSSPNESSIPKCGSLERIKLPAKVSYEWEIIKVETLDRKTNTDKRYDWPARWPKGGFRQRRNVEVGLKETGESVLYYHPYLENIGDVAVVLINATIRDKMSYNRPKPNDSRANLPILLRITRKSEKKLWIEVYASSAPPPPEISTEIATTDCPCRITKKWENPSPIEAEIIEIPQILACGESIKLRVSGTDTDKLVIWCQGENCDNSVKEMDLSDPLSYQWSASEGSFPAGNKGETIIFKAPISPRKVSFTVTVTDSKKQYQDDPVTIRFSIDVRRHPVVIVPGLLASTLELDKRLIWPPDLFDVKEYFIRRWRNLILNKDGTSSFNVTTSAMFDDAGMYGRDHYGKMQKALIEAGHFPFGSPYDWRKALENSALVLDKHVQRALEYTKYPEVSMICHSMGGLVSRQWIAHHQGDSKLGEIVFVATPHHGAPMAYRYLRWGEKVQVEITDVLFDLVTKLSFGSTSDLVRSWPSFYYLLPTEDWFSRYGGFFNDQHDPVKDGWLHSLIHTYVSTDDSRLEMQQHVRAAYQFYRALPNSLPAHIKRYNVYGQDHLTERLYTYSDSPDGGALFNSWKGAIAKKVTSEIATGGKTTMHTFDGDVVYIRHLDGDGTVPTFSAKWEFGKPGWNHEYLVNDAIHGDLTNASKTISYALYWFENLR